MVTTSHEKKMPTASRTIPITTTSTTMCKWVAAKETPHD